MIIKFKLLSRTSKNVQMNFKGYSDAYFVLFLKISIIIIYKRQWRRMVHILALIIKEPPNSTPQDRKKSVCT